MLMTNQNLPTSVPGCFAAEAKAKRGMESSAPEARKPSLCRHWSRFFTAFVLLCGALPSAAQQNIDMSTSSSLYSATPSQVAEPVSINSTSATPTPSPASSAATGLVVPLAGAASPTAAAAPSQAWQPSWPGYYRAGSGAAAVIRPFKVVDRFSVDYAAALMVGNVQVGDVLAGESPSAVGGAGVNGTAARARRAAEPVTPSGAQASTETVSASPSASGSASATASPSATATASNNTGAALDIAIEAVPILAAVSLPDAAFGFTVRRRHHGEAIVEQAEGERHEFE